MFKHVLNARLAGAVREEIVNACLQLPGRIR
jgi:hypothetical protein